MKSIFPIVWLTGCLLSSGLAAHAQKLDTAQTYRLQEVTVTGSALTHYTAGSRLTRLDSNLVSQYSSSSLSEVLQLQMPVYFRSYGQGQLSSLTFRGTSANHTNVLWNGFSINSPTFGSSDFSVLPAFGYSRVEVQHGNSASLWGSGSIGGSVLLSSSPVFSKGWHLQAHAETSRFGSDDFSLSPLKVNYFTTQAQLQYSNSRFHWAGSGWQTHAENNFPYRNTFAFGSPEVRQENAAFRQWGTTQDINWKFAPKGVFSAKIWYTHTYRQAQPSMTEANNGNYRIDESLRTMLSGSYQMPWGETTLKTAFFRDALNWNGENSPVYSYQTQLVHEKQVAPSLSVKGGLEYQYFLAAITGNYRRGENRQSAFLLSEFRPLPPLTLILNLRQVWATGFSPPFTPHLGVNYRIYKTANQEVKAKGTIGRSYRLPTLHDRFWIPGGNASLQPETSFGYEAGLAHQIFARRWQWISEATFYQNNVSNWIQWIPSDQGDWSPQNVQSVRTRGMELSHQIRYTQNSIRISIKTQYFLSQSIYLKPENAADKGKQLPFTPLHTFTILGQIQYKRWSGVWNHGLTGKRENFGDTPPAAPFEVSNASVSREFVVQKTTLQLVLKCNNAFHTQYQTYGYYAMPGRSFSLSIRAQL